jgi:hypothetical protein
MGKWRFVAQKGTAKLLVQRCGDHGTDVELTRTIRVDAAGFHDIRMHSRPCP